MALSHCLGRGASLLLLCAIVAGCAAARPGVPVEGPAVSPEESVAPHPGRGDGPPEQVSGQRAERPAKARREHAEARRAQAEARRGFPQSGQALRAEIAEKAAALKSGPIGERGKELASLRLAESGRDLIDAGSLDGAEDALRKAVSLYARNGFAYLFLAHVEHEKGRNAEARDLLARARRDLPGDKGVRNELDELAEAVGGGGRGT